MTLIVFHLEIYDKDNLNKNYKDLLDKYNEQLAKTKRKEKNKELI